MVPKLFVACLALLGLAFFALAANPTNFGEGALLGVTITGQIGVLLDEFPSDVRSRGASAALGRSDTYWREAVIRQLWLTSYRLIFRPYYYSFNGQGEPNAMQLPIPMDQLSITFTSAATRAPLQGHDVVSRSYVVSTYIVTDKVSVVRADSSFGGTGSGHVDENFVLPIDPYLIYQRTHFDCMDEGGFPVGSLDAENPEYYFDDSCTPEAPYNPANGPCIGCHCMGASTKSCVDSLKDNIGQASIKISYRKLPWDEALARSIEAQVPYDLTYLGGADIMPSVPDLYHNYIAYQYFTPESCTNKECGGTPGWRRLLYFDASNINVGGKELEIGYISYEQQDSSSFDPLAYHNLYYWDTCHQHPHFSAYADYQFGTTPGRKQGFCIQTTGRTINARWVPIVTDNWTCSVQGVETGWNDSYNAGIPCQWIDITNVDTKSKSVTSSLTLTSNPKNWLCEGTINRDANGDPQWVPTGEKTATGQSIDKHNCTSSPNYAANNIASIRVTVPKDGNGVLTAPCSFPNHNLGPKRDCEFNIRTQLDSCTPGQQVNLQCTVGNNAASQVLRFCESSRVLQSGLACRYNEEHILGNFVIRPGVSNAVSFTCPAARDSVEIGGRYSTYSGPVLNGVDNSATITCNVA
jgi:hypothetical protein